MGNRAAELGRSHHNGIRAELPDVRFYRRSGRFAFWGTAQQKEDEIAYLTEGGVLDRYEVLLHKEVIEYADIF